MQKKIGKTIKNILYYTGLIVIFVGIWLIKTDLLLGVKMMPVGLATMFIGWVLDAYEVGYGDDL